MNIMGISGIWATRFGLVVVLLIDGLMKGGEVGRDASYSGAIYLHGRVGVSSESDVYSPFASLAWFAY